MEPAGSTAAADSMVEEVAGSTVAAVAMAEADIGNQF
jgi:hypothetical protein